MKSNKLTASGVNDHLFMAFPLGWFAGVLVGTTYAAFHWMSLQSEVGRTILLAVTASQGVTLALVTLKVRRLIKFVSG